MLLSAEASSELLSEGGMESELVIQWGDAVEAALLTKVGQREQSGSTVDKGKAWEQC